MLSRIAIGLVISLGMAGAAMAQSGRAGVYCINGRIDVAYGSLAQVSSGRGNGENCVIGPTFNDTIDGNNWAKKNLGSGSGGSCSCR